MKWVDELTNFTENKHGDDDADERKEKNEEEEMAEASDLPVHHH